MVTFPLIILVASLSRGVLLESFAFVLLFLCVVTRIIIITFFFKLYIFSLHGTSQEEGPTQTAPRRLHLERQRQDEMAAGENHRSGWLRAHLPG